MRRLSWLWEQRGWGSRDAGGSERSARSRARCGSGATGRGWRASIPRSRRAGSDGREHAADSEGDWLATNRPRARTMKRGRSRDPSCGTTFGRRFGTSIEFRLLLRLSQLLISRLSRHNVYKRSFKPLLERAGLPHTFRFHDLRHTFATLMSCSGGHVKVVQEMLGHATISITLDLYSHVLQDMQEDAVDRLGAMLS